MHFYVPPGEAVIGLHPVAKQDGKPTAELQAAIHWAKDIASVAWIQKLEQLGRVDGALLNCCDSGITDFANLRMSTCHNLMRPTLRQAHAKFGIALEAQDKFVQVEALHRRRDVRNRRHPARPHERKRLAGQDRGPQCLNKAMGHERKWQPDDEIIASLVLTATDWGCRSGPTRSSRTP
jgi:hypothetical protein